MNKEIQKQKFQIGNTVYMIDDDYSFFEATVTDIRLITLGKEAGTIEYTADCDFTDKDIGEWVFESELSREIHMENL